MPSKIRMKRISERVRVLLAEMLVREAADPRLAGITVTDVNVDRELAYADVFVSAVEGEARKKEVLAALEGARGYLRSSLAARVDLRAFPQLRFHWDPTPERADAIERILASLRTEEYEAPGDDGAITDGAIADGASADGASAPAPEDTDETDDV